jgi:hypothetical protein
MIQKRRVIILLVIFCFTLQLIPCHVDWRSTGLEVYQLVPMFGSNRNEILAKLQAEGFERQHVPSPVGGPRDYKELVHAVSRPVGWGVYRVQIPQDSNDTTDRDCTQFDIMLVIYSFGLRGFNNIIKMSSESQPARQSQSIL